MDNIADSHPSRHVSDDVLEAYALKRLSGNDLDTLEDHLLLCEDCRSRLEEAEDFVAAMRQASQKLRNEEFFRQEQPTLWQRISAPFLELSLGSRAVWASGLAVAVFGLALLNTGTPPTATVYQDVNLTAIRGVESPLRAETNHWLRLHLDLQNLQHAGASTVAVADGNGRAIWQSQDMILEPGAAELVVKLDRKLAKGNYWVRLSSGGELLREYSLQVR